MASMASKHGLFDLRKLQYISRLKSILELLFREPLGKGFVVHPTIKQKCKMIEPVAMEHP